MWACSCLACTGLMSFGVRAVFSLDACGLPLCVLAVSPGEGVCRNTGVHLPRRQGKAAGSWLRDPRWRLRVLPGSRGGSWCLVVGPSAAAGVCSHLWQQGGSHPSLELVLPVPCCLRAPAEDAPEAAHPSPPVPPETVPCLSGGPRPPPMLPRLWLTTPSQPQSSPGLPSDARAKAPTPSRRSRSGSG